MKVLGEWQGRISRKEQGNVLADSFHRQPLKVAKPFRGKSGELIIYLMDGSPGLFNGDEQHISCVLEPDTHLYLTNQSSCKCYDSSSYGASRQQVTFDLKQNSVLEYWPEPLVPFQGSCFEGKMLLRLEHGAQAIVGDILTPGRIGRGELFQYERIWNQFIVEWDGTRAVWDSMLLEPGAGSLQENGWFGDYSHLGTLWILSEQRIDDIVQEIRCILQEQEDIAADIYAGVSMLSRGGCVIRLLGRTVRRIQQVLKICWSAVRLSLLKLPEPVIRK